MIDLANYQMSGSGIGSRAELDELRKALYVGHLRGGDPANVSAGSLKVESLERTLKDLQFKERDVALWAKVPKLPAYSTVEEYERLLDYGQDSGGFINEGDLPDEHESTYERVAELVKYIGTVRSVSLQAQMVNTMVNGMMKHAVMTGTKWVLRKADRALSFADASVIPAEFNGFFALHRNAYATLNDWQKSVNVIDMRGRHISEDKMEEGAQVVVDHHGNPDLFIGATDVISNFAKQFHGKKFFQPNTSQVTNGVVGQRVKLFASQFGDISLDYDKFMRQAPRTASSAATHSKAPVAPVPDPTTPVAAVTDAQTQFSDSDGDYYVAVAAVNRHGESPLAFLSASAVSVATTQSLDLKFTAATSGEAADGFIIYMSEKDDATPQASVKMYPVFAIGKTQLTAGYDGGAAGIVRNRNRFMPNTRKAILTENTQEIWSFKQLAPIMKMDLARISTADRFMVLMFGTPQLYMPKKMVIYINVGAYVAP